MNNDDEYDTGYRKPPKANQFKKGQSGNPKGRKKGSKNKKPSLSADHLGAIIIGEAYQNVKVTDNYKKLDMPMATAVVRSISVSAAKGKLGAQKLFIEMLGEAERREKRRRDEILIVALEYKEFWGGKFADCAARGIAPPEIYPHPDDVHIDCVTGAVGIKGPLTKEMKIEDDNFRERKAGLKKSFAENEKLLRRKLSPDYREFILEDQEFMRRCLEMLEKIVPN